MKQQGMTYLRLLVDFKYMPVRSCCYVAVEYRLQRRDLEVDGHGIPVYKPLDEAARLRHIGRIVWIEPQ